MWNIPLVAVCLQRLHTRKVRVVFYIQIMLASWRELVDSTNASSAHVAEERTC
jgi:hypothetical protein